MSMSIERRGFLKTIGVGALAATIKPPFVSRPESAGEQEQKVHHDFRTNNPGAEYFCLGNGLVLVAVQVSPKPEDGTHLGLLFMSAEHFARKMSTYLFHPERGLLNTRFTAVIDGKGYVAQYDKSTVRWEYPDGIPTIAIEWEAGGCSVHEELMCPVGDPAVVRAVTIHNTGATAVQALGTVLLYPNLMYFDEYSVDRKRMTLAASGYQTMELFTSGDATAGDRHLSIQFGEIPPGGKKSVTIVLTLNMKRGAFEKKGMQRMLKETKEYWAGRTAVDSGNENLNHLFDCSKTGLRAGVARSGKMDASIWQYNFEWVRDSSMVAIGCALSGHTDIAGALLRRILERSVDDEGRAIDASRHRPPETIELDQNGELIYALWTHWVWTGNDAIIKDYWPKIKAVADYVLRPEFRDPATGLLKNSREFWERDPGFGVREGYELAYQVWNIVGLQAGSEIAGHMKDPAAENRWLAASRLMKDSFLHHPTYSFVDDGKFIKRRLADGQVQRTFEPPNRKAMPPGVPLNVESISYVNPDTSSVLPIMLDVLDPRSPVALKTLESMEELWNQRWTTGGYGRYHVTSEPDSPGPWPFATMFLARAYFEAGNDEKVWRALDWLLKAPGGKAGAWFECYVDRPVPPLPPLGIVIWTWAEIVEFFVHHLLGVRPTPKTLMIRPRLLQGLDGIKAKVVVRGREIILDLKRTTTEARATVNRKKVNLQDGALILPLPKQNLTVEMHI